MIRLVSARQSLQRLIRSVLLALHIVPSAQMDKLARLAMLANIEIQPQSEESVSARKDFSKTETIARLAHSDASNAMMPTPAPLAMPPTTGHLTKRSKLACVQVDSSKSPTNAHPVPVSLKAAQSAKLPQPARPVQMVTTSAETSATESQQMTV